MGRSADDPKVEKIELFKPAAPPEDRGRSSRLSLQVEPAKVLGFVGKALQKGVDLLDAAFPDLSRDDRKVPPDAVLMRLNASSPSGASQLVVERAPEGIRVVGKPDDAPPAPPVVGVVSEPPLVKGASEGASSGDARGGSGFGKNPGQAPEAGKVGSAESESSQSGKGAPESEKAADSGPASKSGQGEGTGRAPESEALEAGKRESGQGEGTGRASESETLEAGKGAGKTPDATQTRGDLTPSREDLYGAEREKLQKALDEEARRALAGLRPPTAGAGTELALKISAPEFPGVAAPPVSAPIGLLQAPAPAPLTVAVVPDERGLPRLHLDPVGTHPSVQPAGFPPSPPDEADSANSALLLARPVQMPLQEASTPELPRFPVVKPGLELSPPELTMLKPEVGATLVPDVPVVKPTALSAGEAVVPELPLLPVVVPGTELPARPPESSVLVALLPVEKPGPELTALAPERIPPKPGPEPSAEVGATAAREPALLPVEKPGPEPTALAPEPIPPQPGPEPFAEVGATAARESALLPVEKPGPELPAEVGSAVQEPTQLLVAKPGPELPPESADLKPEVGATAPQDLPVAEPVPEPPALELPVLKPELGEPAQELPPARPVPEPTTPAPEPTWFLESKPNSEPLAKVGADPAQEPTLLPVAKPGTESPALELSMLKPEVGETPVRELPLGKPAAAPAPEPTLLLEEPLAEVGAAPVQEHALLPVAKPGEPPSLELPVLMPEVGETPVQELPIVKAGPESVASVSESTLMPGGAPSHELSDIEPDAVADKLALPLDGSGYLGSLQRADGPGLVSEEPAPSTTRSVTEEVNSDVDPNSGPAPSSSVDIPDVSSHSGGSPALTVRPMEQAESSPQNASTTPTLDLPSDPPAQEEPVPVSHDTPAPEESASAATATPIVTEPVQAQDEVALVTPVGQSQGEPSTDSYRQDRPTASQRAVTTPTRPLESPSAPSAEGQNLADSSGSDGEADQRGDDRRPTSLSPTSSAPSREARQPASALTSFEIAERAQNPTDEFIASETQQPVKAGTQKLEAVANRHAAHTVTSLLKQTQPEHNLAELDEDSALHGLGLIMKMAGGFSTARSQRVQKRALALADELGVNDFRTRKELRYGSMLQDLGHAGLALQGADDQWLGEMGEFLQRNPGLNLRTLHQATVLRDIGQVAIPESIRARWPDLTEEEQAVMQLHPELGQQIVSAVPSLRGLGPIIRSHHERWDGQGYPDGLRGTQIPLSSRIIAVADVFEQMLAEPGTSFEDARQAVRQQAGGAFDPLLIQAFDRLLETEA